MKPGQNLWPEVGFGLAWSGFWGPGLAGLRASGQAKHITTRCRPGESEYRRPPHKQAFLACRCPEAVPGVSNKRKQESGGIEQIQDGAKRTYCLYRYQPMLIQ